VNDDLRVVLTASLRCSRCLIRPVIWVKLLPFTVVAPTEPMGQSIPSDLVAHLHILRSDTRGYQTSESKV